MDQTKTEKEKLALERYYKTALFTCGPNFENRIDKLKAKNFYIRNPFVEAADLGVMRNLEALYNAFPDYIDKIDERGIEPFQQAIKSGNLDAALFIFQKSKVFFKKSSECANQLLMEAVIQNRLDIVDLISTYGNIDYLYPNGLTAMHQAAIGNNDSIIKLLILKKATVNCVNKHGDTPLHAAVRCGSNLAAKTLIKVLPEQCLNQPNMAGDTALHLAVCRRNFDVIRSLLKYGADVSLKNINQQSSLDLAKSTGNAELEMVLENNYKKTNKPWKKLLHLFKSGGALLQKPFQSIFDERKPSGKKVLKRNNSASEQIIKTDMVKKEDLKPTSYKRCKTDL